MENKNNRLFINTSFITAKKVVYTLFYRKNETVKNHVLNYQIIKNNWNLLQMSELSKKIHIPPKKKK